MSDLGELFSLSDFGITSINLTTTPVASNGPDTVFWSDTNKDGVIDPDEIFASAAAAPAGAIAAQRVDGGYVLQSATINTTSGPVAAYSVAFDYDPAAGISVAGDAGDVTVTHQDGSVETFHLVSGQQGVSLDANASHYRPSSGVAGTTRCSPAARPPSPSWAAAATTR